MSRKFDLLATAPDLADLAAEIGATLHVGSGFVHVPGYCLLWTSRDDGPVRDGVEEIRDRLRRVVAQVKVARSTPAQERAERLLARLREVDWVRPGWGAQVRDGYDVAVLHHLPFVSKHDADVTVDGEKLSSGVHDTRQAALDGLAAALAARWPA